MDEIEMLRRVRPEVDDPSKKVVTAARATLMDRVQRTGFEQKRGERPPRRWLAPSIAAVAALIVVILVQLLPLRPPRNGSDESGSRGGTRIGGIPASAAEALNAAAAVATEQPPLRPPADGYVYTKTMSLDLSTVAGERGGSVSALVPEVREVWVHENGSGRIVITKGDPVFLSDADRKKWQSAVSPEMAAQIRRLTSRDEVVGPGTLSTIDYASLPRDVDALFELVRARAEQTAVPLDTEMFVIVGDFLRDPSAPPDLRAALYRVAAQIPGVELLGEVNDPEGRLGLGVAMTSRHGVGLTRKELIFDRATSSLLAERTVLLERVDGLEVEPPAIIGYRVQVGHGFVNSTSSRP